MLFGVSPGFWLQSNVAEVYTLQCFFFASVLYLIFRWHLFQDIRWLLLGAFLYGVSAGVHASMAFFLPGIAVFLLLVQPRIIFSRTIFLLGFFFILGLSVYLYLPLRSSADPSFDWGNAEHVRGFWNQVTDRKGERLHYAFDVRSLGSQVLGYGKMVMRSLTGWGVILAGIGALAVFYRNARAGVFLLTLFLGYVSLSIGSFSIYASEGIDEIMFLPSILIFSLWTGLGLVELGNVAEKIKITAIRPRRLITVVTFLFFVFALVGNYRTADKSEYYLTHTTMSESLLQLDRGSIALVTVYWFPLQYLQDIERMREDVAIIPTGFLSHPQYFSPITPEMFPTLKLPDYRASYANFEGYFQFLNDFFTLNLPGRSVYLEPDEEFLREVSYFYIPEGLFFRVLPKSQVEVSSPYLRNYLRWLREYLDTMFDDVQFFSDAQASRSFYPYVISSLADYFARVGMPEQAVGLMKVSVSLKPENDSYRGRLGFYQFRMGDYQTAESIYRGILTRDERNKEVRLNLIELLVKTGNLKEARREVNMIFSLSGTKAFPGYLGRALILEAEGDIQGAVRELEKALMLPMKGKDRIHVLNSLKLLKSKLGEVSWVKECK